MAAQDEEVLLRSIRLVPMVVLAISFISAWLIFEHSSAGFEQRLADIERSSMEEHRQQLVREVQRVVNFIEDERRATLNRIKKSNSERTIEAANIVLAIQAANPNLPKPQIKHLAAEAIRPIRFNEGRGYFFIYDVTGKSVMHPILTHNQGLNMWDFQDTKGQYAIRQLSEFAQAKRSDHLTWWWRKPDDLDNEYEKVGFSRLIEPFGWFIGTGEYVLDYEQELKQELLAHINKIRPGQDSRIFVLDPDGNFLDHQPNYCRPHCRLGAGEREALAISDGFTYLNADSEKSKKLAYFQTINDWGWKIMTLYNQSELEALIEQRQTQINHDFNAELFKLFAVTLALAAALLFLSLLYSKQVAIRFNRYKAKVEKKSKQLKLLNKNLESTVAKRTEELQTSLTELKQTQAQLVRSQKMAGLVELVNGVAHELNTPLGVAQTMVTLVEDCIEQQGARLPSEELERLRQSIELLGNNINKAILLVQNFKSLSIHDESRQLRSIQLSQVVESALGEHQLRLNEYKVQAHNNVPEELNLVSDLDSIKEALSHLITNSCAHAFDKSSDGNRIEISAKVKKQQVVLTYSDNGLGVEVAIREKIFEPFFTTKRGSRFTGLGLPIVYNHVTHRLNGELEIDQKPNRGLSFRLTLPRSIAA